MDTSDLANLAERLDRLESESRRRARQRRWLQRAGAIALVSAMVAGVAGAQQGGRRVVEAQAFVLKDKTGTVRARLDSNPRQGTFLYLFDDQGQTIRFGASTGKDGHVLLRFTDPKGEPRLDLGVHPEGMPHLALFSKDQKALVRLGISPEEEAGISLFGKNDRARVQIISPDDEPPLLEMFDDAGKTLFRVPRLVGK